MLVVGLTGGIGSGKSTVADLFAARGVPVIDTDRIARELVEPGLPALEAIHAHFGDAVIGADGRLDRAALRNLVFDDPERRRALEAILHPRIRREVRERIAALDAPYCLVAIPLLVETGQRDLVDRVLVVDAPPDVQLRRTVARDDLSAAQVQAIMASQASRQARLAAADEVIANDRDLAHLQSEVARLHALYRQLSTV